MRRAILFILIAVLLFSCAPVLRKDLMQAGNTSVPLAQMQETPLLYEGKLYILGGLVARTRNTPRGSVIEAVYVPVDSYGYLKDTRSADGRFLAVLPKSKGYLDPEIYRRTRQVTIAGVFTGTEKGKLDEVDYIYPVFEIKQIYLWEEEKYYNYPPYSPWYGPSPYYYSPYGSPYPFWWDDPFWRHRYPYWW